MGITPVCETGKASSSLVLHTTIERLCMEEFRGSDQFMTPPDELAFAREYMGGIDIDPASSLVAAPYVQAKRFAISTSEANEAFLSNVDMPSHMFIDGLTMKWQGNVWLNPPYSKGLIDAFTQKALASWNMGHIRRMLILVNSQTDTKWYQSLASNSTYTFIYRGRLKFWKMVDGVALPKWQGQKNKDDIASGKTEKVKIGNQPRFLNTLFLFESDSARLPLFREMYSPRGTILIPERD